MARFFISKEQIIRDKVEIVGSDVHHISKVLRLRTGDMVSLADGEGTEYEVKIVAISKDKVECMILNSYQINREPPVELILCQGLPKGDKLELIIQKSVEIGVSRIVPVKCERTVVHLSGDKATKRLDRWQRVAIEAAKQSRRSRVPEISPLMPIENAFELVPDGAVAVMPWEEEKALGLKKVLAGVSKNYNGQVWIFIGPEGGLTQQEADKARSRGVIPVTLGPRILRTETAGIATLAVIMYQLGDLGGIEN